MSMFFLISVFVFSLGAVASGIYGVVFSMKLHYYLQKDEPTRFLGLEKNWKPFSFNAWKYVNSDQDDNNKEIVQYKLKIRKALLQIVLFFIAALVNSAIFAVLEFHLFS